MSVEVVKLPEILTIILASVSSYHRASWCLVSKQWEKIACGMIKLGDYHKYVRDKRRLDTHTAVEWDLDVVKLYFTWSDVNHATIQRAACHGRAEVIDFMLAMNNDILAAFIGVCIGGHVDIADKYAHALEPQMIQNTLEQIGMTCDLCVIKYVVDACLERFTTSQRIPEIYIDMHLSDYEYTRMILLGIILNGARKRTDYKVFADIINYVSVSGYKPNHHDIELAMLSRQEYSRSVIAMVA